MKRFEIDKVSDGYLIYDNEKREYVMGSFKPLKLKTKREATDWIRSNNNVLKWAKTLGIKE